MSPIAERDRSHAGSNLQWFWLCAILLSLAACGKKNSPTTNQNLSAEVIDSFYVGVASLDVEENERASTLFADLSTKLPDEPAVWANLGIVRLRLGNVVAAEQALATAEKLAPANRQITVAQAIVDERQGQFPRAIERLRKIPNPDATVLYQLVELFGRTGQPDAPREQLALYDRILQSEPTNLVALFGKARLLTRGENQAELAKTLTRLDTFRTNWTEESVQQLDAAKAAVAAGNLRTTATHLTFLQNLTLATSQYKAALAKLGAPTGSVGQPIREFLKYPQPTVLAAAADTALQFEITADTNSTSPPQIYSAVLQGTNTAANVLSLRDGTIHWNGTSQSFTNLTSTNASLCAVDLNGDYTEDFVLLTDKGLSIFLQNNQGQLTNFIPPQELRATFAQPGNGVWPFDFEADGDLDLLLSQTGSNPRVLRNNGDIGSQTTGRASTAFTPLDLTNFVEPRDVCWADFDADGDNDLALLGTNGRLLISWNERAGSFTSPTPVSDTTAQAMTFGDTSATGEMALIALESDGSIKRFAYDSTQQKWSIRDIATTTFKSSNNQSAKIHLADLDNNGAIDLVLSSGTSTDIWLNEGLSKFQKLEKPLALFVTSIVDIDGDGFLDLLGTTATGAATARVRGTKGYHWQSIQTRALASQADGRINSFGIGGKIEIRAGQLLAVAPITSPRTHFGLGNNIRAGIARIVWPNGTAQVEFELRADQHVTAMQRLKGSCPWVFTRAGDKFHFVKDFIWRSPLGMRINSQDTAGVDQTEDWIFIPGDLLTPHNDRYEIRITAELWETHFFDHVSLMVVDHPASFEVFVDERFVPTQQPKLAVIAVERPRPFAFCAR